MFVNLRPEVEGKLKDGSQLLPAQALQRQLEFESRACLAQIHAPDRRIIDLEVAI